MATSAAASAAAAPQTPAEGYLAVHVRGKLTAGPASADAFYRHSLHNARNSVLEPGVSRFDVLRRVDPGAADEFLLIEVYNSPQGPDEHKASAHYDAWRQGVAALMAQPRSAVKYTTIFPPPGNWRTDKAAGAISEEVYSRQVPWAAEPFAPEAADAGATVHEALMDGMRGGGSGGMLAVLVDVQVVEGSEDAFIAATLANCSASLREPGVQRFDLLRNRDDPRNFALVEVYNTACAPAEHKATPHYAQWAEAVKSMMARPRSAMRYATKFPAPLFWHRSAFVTHPGEGAMEAGDSSAYGLSGVSGNAFGFLSPKVVFGRGIASKAIASAMKEQGMKKPFIVTGKSGFDRLRSSVLAPSGACPAEGDAAGIPRYAVGGEPTVEDAQAATALALRTGCDSVLAVGGGSAIDLGKAVAALMTNKGDVLDYLEVVGRGMAIEKPPAPFIAVPTTSGTGSEATKNAVLKCTKQGRKASMRADTMLPNVAILDPCLTLSCPADVTAHVGLDTLCQVIEPYISNATNPIVDALAKEGILRASRSLRAVVANGSDLHAREDLAIASLLGGLSLANAKLGAVHGYAAVLGGMFEHAPHGAICAALLPHVFRRNAEVLERSASAGDLTAKRRLGRLRDVATIVTGNPSATVMQGALWLEALVRDLAVPPLSQLCPGMTAGQVPEVAKASADSSSTKGNPVVLSLQDMEDILRAAL